MWQQYSFSYVIKGFIARLSNARIPLVPVIMPILSFNSTASHQATSLWTGFFYKIKTHHHLLVVLCSVSLIESHLCGHKHVLIFFQLAEIGYHFTPMWFIKDAISHLKVEFFICLRGTLKEVDHRIASCCVHWICVLARCNDIVC